MLTVLYLAAILLCCILAITYRKYLATRGMHIFIPFLVYVFLQETIAITYIQVNKTASTAVVYNLYLLISAAFYSWFFMRVPFNHSVRKLIGGLLVLYLLLAVIVYSFFFPINVYNTYLSHGGNFIITLGAVMSLFNYFKLDNSREERKWLPVVWISMGIVIFYPVVNISFALYKHIQATGLSLFGKPIYQLIPQTMSIILYSCYARSFYLCKKRN